MTLNSAFGAKLIKIRLGQDEPKKARIVLDVSTPVKWNIEDQTDPNILKLSLAADLSTANLPKNSMLVKEIQLNTPLVLIFHKPIAVQKAFSIAPNAENENYRIVLDILVGSKSSPSLGPIKKTDSSMGLSIGAPISIPEDKPVRKVIVIDAGHGGEDPGTVGYNNSHEKDITFKMAKALKETIEVNPKYKVILTRVQDRFVRLRDRVKIARREKGDLFISLHADSHSSKEARGLSVYTLSHVASDRDAERLAAKENKADLIMGLELETETPEVANILIDLVKRETMNMSAKFAGTLIKALGKRVQLLRNTHRFAAFAVLRAPEIPSVLIELGFLSNKEDEKLLNSRVYRQKIADGIAQGIEIYFQKLAQSS